MMANPPRRRSTAGAAMIAGLLALTALGGCGADPLPIAVEDTVADTDQGDVTDTEQDDAMPDTDRDDAVPDPDEEVPVADADEDENVADPDEERPYVAVPFQIPTAVGAAPFRLLYRGGSPTSARFTYTTPQPGPDGTPEAGFTLEVGQTHTVAGYSIRLIGIAQGGARLAVTDPTGALSPARRPGAGRRLPERPPPT